MNFADDFCGYRFGEDKQLEVLAVIAKVGYTKTYSVKCHKCAEDVELFGDGIFKSYRSNILRNYLPCGCGARPLWNEAQFKIICERKASERGFLLIGFSGEYKGNKTRLELFCTSHGVWNTTDINHFLNGRGCPGCKAVTCAEVASGNTHTRKDDGIMIESFLNSGAFHPDTKFTRCDPETTNRPASDWVVECPECSSVVIARSTSLKIGYKVCECSNSRQRFSYIHTIIDAENIIALKYGIAVNPEERLKRQSSKSIYNMENYGVWEFQDYQSCRDAETLCKRTLSQALSKIEVPDGFSETTYPYNIDRIITIYEEHGGVRLNANC